PNLGVVRVGQLQSFVMADIPGLIEGAADGAGLGIRFLKHLQRTRLLLHIVDIAPLDTTLDPANAVRQIVNELARYSDELVQLPRWLVINKIDLLDAEERAARRDKLLADLGWDGPVFEVSAATAEGTEALGYAIMQALEQMDADAT
ncbi:MAG: GTPase, partial [Woeseiaceae bacterium]|nr:GTPase [Woeseiaceae bacterium]